MTPHVLMMGWSVGASYILFSLKGGKLHSHTPIGALVYFMYLLFIGRPVLSKMERIPTMHKINISGNWPSKSKQVMLILTLSSFYLILFLSFCLCMVKIINEQKKLIILYLVGQSF